MRSDSLLGKKINQRIKNVIAQAQERKQINAKVKNKIIEKIFCPG